MSIQPLLPSGYTSLVQSLQKSTSTNSTNNASGTQFDPLSILTGSVDDTSTTSPVDLLFGGSDPTAGDGSLASFLGNSSDTASVFSSFTDEAKAALLQAQEEASKQQTASDATTADGTQAAGSTDPSATASSNANNSLLQALAAMMSPSVQTQTASWL
jgi:hypothetical protein